MIAVYAPAAKQVTIELYQQMGEKGLLTPDDHVQLIEGEILEMPPIGSPHGSAVKSSVRHGAGEQALEIRTDALE